MMDIRNSVCSIRSLYRCQEWIPVPVRHTPQIRTICVPYTEQICSSSGREITIFRPLKRSSCVAFFLQVCSLITVSSSRDESSFAGGTKMFFDQIIYLFLKNFLATGFLVNNKTEKFDQLSLIQIPFFSCNIVSFSSWSKRNVLVNRNESASRILYAVPEQCQLRSRPISNEESQDEHNSLLGSVPLSLSDRYFPQL